MVVATSGLDLASPRDEGFWLGTATNAPTATFVGSNLEVWTTLSAKAEVYVARASYDEKTSKLGKTEKPSLVSLGEDAAGLEERGVLTADGAIGLLVVPEKIGGKKVIRLHALGAGDAGKRQPFTLGEGDESIAEARIAGMANGDVLVATVSLDKVYGSTLKATVLTCGND